MTGIEPWDAPVAVTGGVVVGHDGSAAADVALAWAVEDAARRGCPLHVVRTWMLASTVPIVSAKW